MIGPIEWAPTKTLPISKSRYWEKERGISPSRKHTCVSLSSVRPIKNPMLTDAHANDRLRTMQCNPSHISTPQRNVTGIPFLRIPSHPFFCFCTKVKRGEVQGAREVKSKAHNPSVLRLRTCLLLGHGFTAGPASVLRGITLPFRRKVAFKDLLHL